jgi:hypothetical protein
MPVPGIDMPASCRLHWLVDVEMTPEIPTKEHDLGALQELGVSPQVLAKIAQGMQGSVGGEPLPKAITLREDRTIDLAHADHQGCISFNPQRIQSGMAERFARFPEKHEVAVSKIFEEELVHAVHQSCPGYRKAAKLFGDAALEGDLKPLQTVATALSLYRRCMGGSGRVSAGDLLVNPDLLEQGFGELLRMCAQYQTTGVTTEMVVKPWNDRQQRDLQQRDLQQIADTSIASWCKELEQGSWGLRCRNQYHLLCRVLADEAG